MPLKLTQHMFVIHMVGRAIRLDPRYRVTHWLYLVCMFMATDYYFQVTVFRTVPEGSMVSDHRTKLSGTGLLRITGC